MLRKTVFKVALKLGSYGLLIVSLVINALLLSRVDKGNHCDRVEKELRDESVIESMFDDIHRRHVKLPQYPDHTAHSTKPKTNQLTMQAAHGGRGPHRFQYVINCPDLCTDSEIFLLTWVHSSADNFDQRMLIRDTWAQQSQFPGVSIRTVFILGFNPAIPFVQQSVEAEALIYRDIVQLDFVDSYRNLTYKALSALGWITTHCPYTKYVMKTDDDAFVNMFAVIKHLRDLQHTGYRTSTLMCYIWYPVPVPRRGKWAVTRDEVPYNVYPPYCRGLGYIMTSDVVPALYRASSEVKYLWIDDLYVTGLLVEHLHGAIKHSNMSAAHCHDDHMQALFTHQTEWYKYAFAEVHDRQKFISVWSAVRDLAANTSIVTPSTIRPGHLSDDYLPLWEFFPWIPRPPSSTKGTTTSTPSTRHFAYKSKHRASHNQLMGRS